MLARILLAIDDAALRARLRAVADGPDSVVTELPTDQDWVEQAGQSDVDLVVVQRSALPARDDRLHGTIGTLRRQTAAEVVVVADREDAEDRAGLIAAGCMAVVHGELPDQMLTETLTTLVAKRREAAMQARGAERTDSRFSLGDFVSLSPRMQKFVKVARRLCQSDSTLLLLGETGVGKERLARAIHAASPRASGPFVVLNCGAVPESLLESELFGHEKGAFTGAIRAHRGHFELAHRGTIFLDEIGEMPLHLQVRLLRVLQERTIQRLGSEQPLQIDVRVMAATNRDLLAEMQENRFRPDLYYRLSVVTLDIPPLRERIEDIPVLVDAYLEEFRSQMPSAARQVSPAAMRALRGYPWPGNIRELVNAIERAMLLCEADEIGLEDLPESITGAAAGDGSVEPNAALVQLAAEPLRGLDDTWLDRTLAEARRAWLCAFERSYLQGLLRATRGRVGETAARAGIDPRSLYTKMKQHGLRKEDFRSGDEDAEES